MDANPPLVALFTYGTLQVPGVQLDTFGRIVESRDDVLPGFTVDYLEIEDAHVAGLSGHDVHPIVRPTDSDLDKVVGKVMWITEQELEAADEYEVADYHRVEVRLMSGLAAWVYVAH